MLSVSLRHVTGSSTKARVFLLPFLAFSPSSSSSSSSSSPLFFYSTKTQIQFESNRTQHLSLNPREIALSFKGWFKLQNRETLLLDRIYEILRAPRDEEDERSADKALSELGLRLSENLVLRVLSYGRNDVLSCLKFFDWASRQPGFHHTRATIYAVFKVLSRAKLMSLMLDFLDYNMKPHSYGHRIKLFDTLVMGYAVAGKPEVALQLFGRMRFNGLDLDCFGYHVFLNALVEESCYDAVEMLAKQIASRGFECGVTHSILVKRFCKQHRLEEAERHLRRLQRDGKAAAFGDGHSLSVLIDGLCKNDKFKEAGRLLEEFREMGMVKMEHAYEVWLKALIQVGSLDRALQFLQAMSSLEGYFPDVFRYNLLVCRLLRENRLKEVCDILFEMMEHEIPPDSTTMNAVLCFFCKAGMVDVALELYRSKSELGLTLNSLAYNYLINTLCGDGKVDEAYQVLKKSIAQGQLPGRKTFRILADTLCREGKLDTMAELLQVSLQRNVLHSDVTYDRFISALCQARRVEDGYLVHGELSRANVATTRNTFFNLIYGFTKLNRGDISAKLLIEMQERGFVPTRKLYRDVIRCLCSEENSDKKFFNLLEMQLSHVDHSQHAYTFFIEGAGYSQKPELSREVFELMRQSGIEPNVKLDVIMLVSYIRAGRISDALNFFKDVQQRRGIRRKFYDVMVIGLCKAQRVNIALTFLQEMREKGVVPSVYCYEVLMQSLCARAEYDKAVQVVRDMEKAGRRVTSFIGNVLLASAFRSRALYETWIQLKDPQEAYEMSLLREIIGIFSGCINTTGTIDEFLEKIQRCFSLDIYTYNLLMRRLTLTSMDLACEMFERIISQGFEPNRWSYDILVLGLFKHGRVGEAKMLLEEMTSKGFVLTEHTRHFDQKFTQF